jgi:site-specific DNA-methyltransferase (adenine-specific)
MVERGKPRNKGAYNHREGNGDMVYGKFKNLKTFNNLYYPTNILEFSNAAHKGKLHPTQKPVELLEYLIKTYTNENETVLDNCMGSGSTGVACKNLNRKFIGIELDNTYFEIAKKRIENTNV